MPQVSVSSQSYESQKENLNEVASFEYERKTCSFFMTPNFYCDFGLSPFAMALLVQILRVAGQKDLAGFPMAVYAQKGGMSLRKAHSVMEEELLVVRPETGLPILRRISRGTLGRASRYEVVDWFGASAAIGNSLFHNNSAWLADHRREKPKDVHKNDYDVHSVHPIECTPCTQEMQRLHTTDIIKSNTKRSKNIHQDPPPTTGVGKESLSALDDEIVSLVKEVASIMPDASSQWIRSMAQKHGKDRFRKTVQTVKELEGIRNPVGAVIDRLEHPEKYPDKEEELRRNSEVIRELRHLDYRKVGGMDCSVSHNYVEFSGGVSAVVRFQVEDSTFLHHLANFYRRVPEKLRNENSNYLVKVLSKYLPERLDSVE